MNYCQNCGDAVGEKSRYCKSCGSFLKPIEKFSLEEEDRKFCQHCGSAMGKRYCPSCGSYGRNIKLKTSVLNVGKLFGGGTSKKRKQNKGEQGKAGSIKELFTDLFTIREEWKNNAVNAGLFALMLAFLLGVLVFAINAGIIQSLINTAKKIDPNVDLFELKKFMNALDFKGILWMLFTGKGLHGSLTDGLNIDVNANLAIPFISLPILILLIWFIEVVRKVVLKTERTFYMVAMQSGIFAFFSAILTFVFSDKHGFRAEGKTKEAWSFLQEIGEEVGLNLGDNITLFVGCGVISVFFTMFIVTFLALLILPGLKVEHDVWREVRKTVTIFFGVILCMTMIPGMISAIVLVSKIPCIDFGTGILLFVLATGMYSTAIFTGDTQWCDFSVTLPQILNKFEDEVKLDAFSVQAKSSLTKFFCQISGSEFLEDDGATVSSMPFAALHICVLIVGIVAVLYISIKVWKKFSCDWKMAVVLSLITGGSCAIFLGLLHKLFRIGAEVKIGTSVARAYIGGEGLWLNFIKETFLIGILCMVAYFLWYFTAEKIAQFMIIKTQWVLLGVCICCIFLSIIGVENIKLRNFRPVVENVVIEIYDFAVANMPYEESLYEMDKDSIVREGTDESMKIIKRILEYNPKIQNENYSDIFDDSSSNMSDEY